MSFNMSSYFAGVGTVAVVVVIGFGAGLQMTGMFDDRYQPNKLERRAAGIPEKPEEPAASEVRATADAKTPDTKSPETRPPADAKARPESKPVELRSVTAPEPPKAVEPESPMDMSQRMRQAFDLQPGATQQRLAAASSQPADLEAASAAARDVEIEKAKAERKKAQQRRLAAERRRNREARLNAAAEWVRRQPADIYAAPRSAYAAPRGFFAY